MTSMSDELTLQISRIALTCFCFHNKRAIGLLCTLVSNCPYSICVLCEHCLSACRSNFVEIRTKTTGSVWEKLMSLLVEGTAAQKIVHTRARSTPTFKKVCLI